MQIAIERICKKWLCSSVWTTHTYCKKNQRISKMKKHQREAQKHLTWLGASQKHLTVWCSVHQILVRIKMLRHKLARTDSLVYC